MLGTPYVEILRAEGFQPAGELNYRLHLSAWWHPAPDRLLQVIVLPLGDTALVKGDKSYYLKSVSTEGETWARDIGSLHDYLEAHFPELRIAFSHFRDVPPDLAKAEVRRRLAVEAPMQPLPTVEEIAQLQNELQAVRRAAHMTNGVMALMAHQPDLLTGYLREKSTTARADVDRLQGQLDRKRQRLDLLQHLQREYQQKGSAAVYAFSISSNVQVAESADQFRVALRAVGTELTDMHRYQVTQKLAGGRLNIHVAEATEPAVAWIEQWFGGALSPNQTRRLNPQFDRLRSVADDHTMVTPDDPIVVEGHVRHAEKHLAAHVVSDVLRRLDNPDLAVQKAALSPESVSADVLPLTLGWHVGESGKLGLQAVFPLAQMGHVYISGTTGSGKSFLARVLMEEAAQHQQLGVLVLDPRNQSAGLLLPEDHPKVLRHYDEFGVDVEHARGFAFSYLRPPSPMPRPCPRTARRWRRDDPS
jgi:hypothetical protein